MSLNRRERFGLRFFEPSLTEQDHKNECDIGYIISCYVRTGQLPPQSQPNYMDCASVQDFETAQSIVADAKTQFYSLPSSERERFVTIQDYLKFISDPSNLRESYERNYINRDSVNIEDVYPEQYRVQENSVQSQGVVSPGVSAPETQASPGGTSVSATQIAD